MKLLVSLSSYGTKNVNYLEKVIDEFVSYKNYDVTVSLHCTVPLSRTDIKQEVYDNPKNNCLFHREEFIREKDNYDLFLFAEYDILIKEAVIDTYLKYDKVLPIGYCAGFLRYEDTPEDMKYYIDIWPHAHGGGYIKSHNTVVNGREYFVLTNPHQACYLLTKEKLNYVINNTQYNFHELNGLGIESAASTVFSDWSYSPTGIIKKVYPKNKQDLENLQVHHTPDCHVNEPGVNTDPLTYRNTSATLDILIRDVNIQN